MEIAISEFKTHCIQLIKSAAEKDEELLITLRGKPMARVTGIPSSRKRVLGGQRGVIEGNLADETLIRSDFGDDWEP